MTAPLASAPILDTALTIGGMALATYSSRAAGLALMSRVTVTGRMERFMKAIPASILAAIVAPSALSSGPADALATAATALTAWKLGNLPVAMAVGVGSALALRALLA